MIPPPATRQLSTAAERREVLIEAAVAAFAEHGFHGTPTTEIAKAAGISQAYLFRLFPTKSELYVAAVDRCYQRLGAAMRAAAEDESAPGDTVLERMGHAYAGLLQDPTTLRATLQAFAAAAGDDLAIRDAVRRGYGELIELIRRLTDAEGEALQAFVARGMLMTVLAGMDAPSIDADWARELCGGGMEEKLPSADASVATPAHEAAG
ncbi:MAG TPA: TetR/AcrR family transcriptional regulator [Conexibacter sp.]|nr:TetR/AcrR family transcriptional regulator [Conexibacter sp.]